MVSGEYPSNPETGRTAGASFVFAHLSALNELYGPEKRMTETQLNDLSSIIATEYPSLKVTELILFVRMFKGGKFGHFYGSIDPMVITSAMNKFVAETRPYYANLAIRHNERQKAVELRKEIQNGITLDEYVADKSVPLSQRSNLIRFAERFKLKEDK